MNNYFIETLKSFLTENITDTFFIQDLSIWRKNNNLKITLILKKLNGFANLEECSSVHKLIKLWVKKENIPDKINIEVQSESIDKKLIYLQDFQENINQKIDIELKDKQDGQRHFKGFLIEVKDDMLTLRTQNNEYALNFKNIKKAKIIPEI